MMMSQEWVTLGDGLQEIGVVILPGIPQNSRETRCGF